MMLTIALSLLFTLAAVVAIAVVRASLVTGVHRARVILAELAEIERRAWATRPAPARPQHALRRALAAA